MVWIKCRIERERERERETERERYVILYMLYVICLTKLMFHHDVFTLTQDFWVQSSTVTAHFFNGSGSRSEFAFHSLH